MKHTCSIEGCTKPVVARGMCVLHYERWRKHGDPLVTKGRWDNHEPVVHTCSISGCDKPIVARGLCRTHYMRWNRHGDVDTVLPRHVRPKRPAEIRFAEKTREEGDCLIWTASKDAWGYGTFPAFGETRAHRVAWVMEHGPIPDGLFVLHRCDNPACVKVDHLFLGTHTDNMRDMEGKGRAKHPAGESHGTATQPESVPRGAKRANAKLNDELVREIRQRYAAGESQQRIANDYGVNQTIISDVVRRVTWKHVTD